MKSQRVIELDDEEKAAGLLATSADAGIFLEDYLLLLYKAVDLRLGSVHSSFAMKSKLLSSAQEAIRQSKTVTRATASMKNGQKLEQRV